jgi:hypothetical protein
MCRGCQLDRFGVVHDLGTLSVGEPRRNGRLIGRIELGRVEPGGLVRRRDRHPGQVAGASTEPARRGDADRHSG